MTTNAAETEKKGGKPKVWTPYFRVSFPNIDEPRKPKPTDPKDKKLKYGLVMLFRTAVDPKATPEEQAFQKANLVDLKDLRAEVLRAVIEKYGADKSKWPTKVQVAEDGVTAKTVSAIRMPFRNGLEKAAKFPGYDAGITFVGATSTGQPGIVGPDGKTVNTKGYIYAGCWARATLNAFVYEGENIGVSFGLQNLQKVRDDAAFGGKTNATDDFGPIDVPEGTPAGAAKAATDADPLGLMG